MELNVLFDNLKCPVVTLFGKKTLTNFFTLLVCRRVGFIENSDELSLVRSPEGLECKIGASVTRRTTTFLCDVELKTY